MDKKKLLLSLPAVDVIVKSKEGIEWLRKYPRVYVIRAIREIIQRKRKTILGGKYEMDDPSDLLQEIERIQLAACHQCYRRCNTHESRTVGVV